MPTPPYFRQHGEDREENDDQYITDFSDGAFVGFKYFDFKGGEKIGVTLTATDDCTLEVSHTLGGEPFAKINVSATDIPAEFVSDNGAESGVRGLFFTYRGKGKADFISINFKGN